MKFIDKMDLATINKGLITILGFLLIVAFYLFVRYMVVWLPHWAIMQYYEYKALKEKQEKSKKNAILSRAKEKKT